MLKLTKEEIECLFDRLQLGDCIFDAICEASSDEEEKNLLVTVQEATENLMQQIEKTACLPPSETLSELEKNILRDCIEGNTWVCFYDEKSKKVITSLAKKVAKCTGFPLEDFDIPCVQKAKRWEQYEHD